MNKIVKNIGTVNNGNLLENKNKIKERDICINASNFDVKNSAITLIGLIITIIVLLILAGVTLNMVMGENGIFGKANIAKEKTNKSTARDTIELKVLEYKTVAASEGKNCTIQGFCEYIIDSEDIATEEQTETSVIAINNGYGFLLNEKLIITEELGIYVAKTDAIYEVKSINNNIANVTITMKNNSGIKKITKPDGESIIPTDNSIEIEYEITVGTEYVFKVQNSDDKEEDYTLKYTNESKPEIIDDGTTGAYPVLTNTGVTSPSKLVAIDYGDSEGQHYYSTDNGSTWNVYENSISISKNCTIMAKSKSNNNVIQKVDKKEVEAKAADDAITSDAYDGNENTYLCTDSYKYIEVDSNIIGKRILTKTANSRSANYLIFVNELGETIGDTITIPSGTNTYEIPEGTVKIGYKGYAKVEGYNWAYLREIGIENTPVINAIKKYPKLNKDGTFSDGYSIVKIDYYETSVQRLYSLDGITWNNYEDIPIEIPYDNTVIYVKGIDDKGNETYITTYTSTMPADALDRNAYDGDENTYVCTDSYKYIEVDSNIIGKRILTKTANSRSANYLIFVNELGETIGDTITIPSGTNTYEIPEGTVKIGYKGYAKVEAYYWAYLREISLEQ